MSNGNKPVHTIQEGWCRAVIWKNQTNDGNKSFYSVTFQRSYKDGDEIKNSTSFSSSELLQIQYLALRAKCWIDKQLAA